MSVAAPAHTRRGAVGQGEREGGSTEEGPKAGGRPEQAGRALALILIVMVALTGGMFLSGHTTPRLGIDLAGGTSITLEAKNQPGRPNAINKTNMDTAVSIIEPPCQRSGCLRGRGPDPGQRQHHRQHPQGHELQAGPRPGRHHRSAATSARCWPRPPGSRRRPRPPPAPPPSGSSSDRQGRIGDRRRPPVTESPSPDGQPVADGSATQGRAVTDALKAGRRPRPASASPATLRRPRRHAARAGRTAEARRRQFAGARLHRPRQPRAKAGSGHGQAHRPHRRLRQTQGDGKVRPQTPPPSPARTSTGEGGLRHAGRGELERQMDFTSKGSQEVRRRSPASSRSSRPRRTSSPSSWTARSSRPRSVSETLTGGSAEISGSFTQQSAEDLANVLSYGALPLSFDEAERHHGDRRARW